MNESKPIVRIAIVGGRDFSDYGLMKERLAEVAQQYTIICVVSGGARGADTLGERWAKENGISTMIFPADWDRFGKSAGFRRNKDIVANADLVVAFWDGKSKGTKSTIDLAKTARKMILIYPY